MSEISINIVASRRSVHILGAPKNHPQIPEVALFDFIPDWRQCAYDIVWKFYTYLEI